MNKTQRGFTLVELVVTVLIISVLAAIAIPSYQGYVARGNRTAVKAVMTEIASRQESFLADRKQYATLLSDLGYPGDSLYLGPGGVVVGSSTGEDLYSIELSGATATAFAIVANAAGIQATRDPECLTLILRSTGQKEPTANDCWG